MTADGQWAHTQPDYMTDAWPLAPWAVHPPLEGMPRDLLAELLAELREEVTAWAEIVAEGSTPYAEARLTGAQRALTGVQRKVERAQTRAAQ